MGGYPTAAAASSSPPQYDANGHPIKPTPHQQLLPQQNTTSHNYNNNYSSNGAGGASYSTSGGPTYDANGNPIKPAQHVQQQQRGNYGGIMPAYAAAGSMGGGGVNGAAPILPQQQQYTPLQSPQYQQQQHTTNQNYMSPGGAIPPPIAPHNAHHLQQRNYWTTGLCDIFADCDVCMEGWCCYCCQEGRLYEAIEFDNPNTTNCSVCMLTCCLAGANLAPLVSFYNRRALIEKYNIQGEACLTTCCFSFCCPYNSSCQMQREMAARGVNPGGQCCVTGGRSQLPPPRSMH